MQRCADRKRPVLFYKPKIHACHSLEPLAEVEGTLLVVEVLHAPHPELGGLLLVGGEHFCADTQVSRQARGQQPRNYYCMPEPKGWRGAHCHVSNNAFNDREPATASLHGPTWRPHAHRPRKHIERTAAEGLQPRAEAPPPMRAIQHHSISLAKAGSVEHVRTCKQRQWRRN